MSCFESIYLIYHKLLPYRASFVLVEQILTNSGGKSLWEINRLSKISYCTQMINSSKQRAGDLAYQSKCPHSLCRWRQQAAFR